MVQTYSKEVWEAFESLPEFQPTVNLLKESFEESDDESMEIVGESSPKSSPKRSTSDEELMNMLLQSSSCSSSEEDISETHWEVKREASEIDNSSEIILEEEEPLYPATQKRAKSDDSESLDFTKK